MYKLFLFYWFVKNIYKIAVMGTTEQVLRKEILLLDIFVESFWNKYIIQFYNTTQYVSNKIFVLLYFLEKNKINRKNLSEPMKS